MTIASDPRDAAAVEAVRAHHAHLAGGLVAREAAGLAEALAGGAVAGAPGPARRRGAGATR